MVIPPGGQQNSAAPKWPPRLPEYLIQLTETLFRQRFKAV
jgi:hypothetical protein